MQSGTDERVSNREPLLCMIYTALEAVRIIFDILVYLGYNALDLELNVKYTLIYVCERKN